MHIYFIKCLDDNGFIKIGVAKNIKSRLDTLQTGCPYPLKVICSIPCKGRPKALAIERRLHSYFAKSRIGGEWFKADIRIKDLDYSILSSRDLDDIGVNRHSRNLFKFREKMIEVEDDNLVKEIDMQILASSPL